MKKLEERLKAGLQERRQAGTLRSLKTIGLPIDFLSNDYLGIARSLKELGLNHPTFGSSGSRLLGGNSPEAEDLEAFLASWIETEAALVFQSGYAANQGLLSAIPSRGDLVLYDELAHACIKDGIRLSNAKAYSFKHNNIENLRSKINRLWDGSGSVIVATEALFSMDGDWAPLEELVALQAEYPIYLVVDEAHSIGITGPNGRGRVAALGLSNHVQATVITFGKAPGMHGAAICGSQTLKEYLINFSRPFIYTTSMPAGTYSALQNSLKFLAENADRRQKLLGEVIDKFNVLKAGIPTDILSFRTSTSPIQMMDLPNPGTAKSIAHELQKAGFAVAAVLPPTVPAPKAAIRITLHSYNTAEEIEAFFLKLKETLG